MLFNFLDNFSMYLCPWKRIFLVFLLSLKVGRKRSDSYNRVNQSFASSKDLPDCCVYELEMFPWNFSTVFWTKCMRNGFSSLRNFISSDLIRTSHKGAYIIFIMLSLLKIRMYPRKMRRVEQKKCYCENVLELQDYPNIVLKP